MNNLIILELIVYNLVHRSVSFILTMVGILLVCLYVSFKNSTIQGYDVN